MNVKFLTRKCLDPFYTGTSYSVRNLRGCLHVKTRTGASLIPVWHCDFIPCLHEGTLRVDQRDCDANLNWISKTAHALPVPDSRESDFILERTPVPCLHDTGMCFRTGMKISLRYSYRSELAPVWLAPLWDFVLADVNEYRATRGNWSELVPEWKSRRYHVNTP